jgi:hypothetical protein
VISNIPTSNEPPSRDVIWRDTLTQFSCLWAAASLFHTASGREWTGLWQVNLAAGWVLLQPGRLVPLAVLAGLQAATTVAKAPFVANHLLLTALLNVALLGAMAIAVVRRRQTPPPQAVMTLWAPAVRGSVIVFYGFVVFHKLNGDFFNAAVSCAGDFYRAQLERMPFLPRALLAEAASIPLTIGFEAAIPLLLLWRRTRHLGAFVGIAFHWLLALNPKDGFYNFSSMLIAVFYLFASDALAGRADARIDRRIRLAARWFVAVVVVLIGLDVSGAARRAGVPDPFFVLWVAYSTTMLIGAVLAMRGRWTRAADTASTFALTSPAMALLPVVVFVNGLSPYAGLKTETSWAMFSNLRTEGGRSNHWIVPAGVQLFDYQRDLVVLVSSSDRGLQSLAEQGYAIPYFEVRRKPDVSIEYIRNGQRQRYERVADDPAYPGPIPWLLRKGLSFRPIAPGEEQPCVH